MNLTFRRTAGTVGALAVAAVLAGCGSDQVGGTASAPGTASTSATAAPAGSPSTTTTTTTMSAPPSRPGAKDGTNYRACFGGNCEVAVSRPVTIRLSDTPIDGGPLTVRKVRAGGVDVRMMLPAGAGISATVKKGCTTAFYGNSASGLAVSSCSREPADITGMYVKQLVTVESISRGTAILRLKSE